MNRRIIDWGVPALLALVVVTSCWLVATADTRAPGPYSFYRLL